MVADLQLQIAVSRVRLGQCEKNTRRIGSENPNSWQSTADGSRPSGAEGPWCASSIDSAVRLAHSILILLHRRPGKREEASRLNTAATDLDRSVSARGSQYSGWTDIVSDPTSLGAQA